MARVRSWRRRAPALLVAAAVLSGLGTAARVEPAAATPAALYLTCKGQNLTALAGGVPQINASAIQTLQGVLIPITLKTDLTAPTVVGAGDPITYHLPITFDLQPLANQALDFVKLEIANALPGTGLENTAYVEITTSNTNLDFLTPAGTSVTGTPSPSNPAKRAT